jgi:hypothetical protein
MVKKQVKVKRRAEPLHTMTDEVFDSMLAQFDRRLRLKGLERKGVGVIFDISCVSLSGPQKIKLHNVIVANQVSQREAESLTGRTRGFYRKIGDHISTNKPMLLGSGRPALLTQFQFDRLVALCKARQDEDRTLEKGEFKVRLLEAANESLRERGYTIALNDDVHPDTVDSYIDKIGKAVIGQRKTEARIISERDIRNFISFAVMSKVLSVSNKPQYSCNFDATQLKFISGNKTTKLVAVEPVDDEAADGERKSAGPITTTTKDANELDMFIKFYSLHNADGQFAAPLFIIGTY